MKYRKEEKMAEVNSTLSANATVCVRTKQRQLFNECDDRDLTVFLNLIVCLAVIVGIVAVILVSQRVWQSCRNDPHTCLAEAEMAELSDNSIALSM